MIEGKIYYVPLYGLYYFALARCQLSLQIPLAQLHEKILILNLSFRLEFINAKGELQVN